jgi:hypothetical protein
MTSMDDHGCKSQSHQEYVTLKEHILRLMAEYKESVEMALKIRTDETERRLEFLNGEADRLRKMQETYVLKEAYDLQHENMRYESCQRFDMLINRLDRTDKEIESLKLSRERLAGKADQSSLFATQIMAIIGIILAIISLVGEFWK